MMSGRIATVDQGCLIDLHLHLDGSISVPMARRLAELGGIEVDESDKQLSRRLSVRAGCRDLNEYLACFDFPLQLLQTREQLMECAYLFEGELEERGIMYAEAWFSPQSHGTRGLSQRDAVEAVLEGFSRSGYPCGVILCCMRGNDNHEANFETVRLAHEYLDRGVVAVDLAGAEALFPTQDFEREFALASKLDVPFTIHAGEAAGPDSVRHALAFGARRIGHGVRSAEDPELLDELARLGVTLETCPTSEIQTCVYDGYASFPLRQLLDAGVRVTVNSDNMAVSATDVRCELQALAQTFELTDADVETLLLNAADAAFASDEFKESLRRRIVAEFERPAKAQA